MVDNISARGRVFLRATRCDPQGFGLALALFIRDGYGLCDLGVISHRSDVKPQMAMAYPFRVRGRCQVGVATALLQLCMQLFVGLCEHSSFRGSLLLKLLLWSSCQLRLVCLRRPQRRKPILSGNLLYVCRFPLPEDLCSMFRTVLAQRNCGRDAADSVRIEIGQAKITSACEALSSHPHPLLWIYLRSPYNIITAQDYTALGNSQGGL